MMTLAPAAEALAHVHAAEALLLAHPPALAGKHWRRALLALGYAEDALEEGRQVLEGPRLEEAERRARVDSRGDRVDRPGGAGPLKLVAALFHNREERVELERQREGDRQDLGCFQLPR